MRLRRLAALALLIVAAVTFSPSSAQAANPILHFSNAYPNSPGADNGSNTSLNNEYVVVKNSSATTTYTLTGHTISDKSGHVYTFPTFNLRPGGSVWLHTGSGANTSAHLYWGASYYIWNNAGDTAYLKGTAGGIKDSCTWPSVGSFLYVC